MPEMQTQVCTCKIEAEFRLVSPIEWKRIRQLLQKWRFPTFIGEEMIIRNAERGGVYEIIYKNESIAVIIYNTHLSILYTLCIAPTHRNHNLGSRIINYFKFWYIRALESSTLFFEKLGYMKISTPKQGRKYVTWIMVRKDLLNLVGRFSKIRKNKTGG